MKKRFILPVVLLTMAVIAGCASQKETKTAQEQSSEKQETIMVVAAASLEKCFTQDLIPMFEKEHGNILSQLSLLSRGAPVARFLHLSL